MNDTRCPRCTYEFDSACGDLRETAPLHDEAWGIVVAVPQYVVCCPCCGNDDLDDIMREDKQDECE